MTTILIIVVAFLVGVIWGMGLLITITDYKMRKLNKKLNSQYKPNKDNEKTNGK